MFHVILQSSLDSYSVTPLVLCLLKSSVIITHTLSLIPNDQLNLRNESAAQL